MSQYQVVPADLERDENEIFGVWGRNYGPALRAETLPWFYCNCPHGPVRIWLLVDNSRNSIAGTIGVGPRRVKVGGTTVVAGLGAGFAVDKEHRHLSPTVLMAKTSLKALREEMAFVYPS